MSSFADHLTLVAVAAKKRGDTGLEEASPDRGPKRTRAAPIEEDARHKRLEEHLVAATALHVEDLPEFLTLFADRTLAWSDAARRLRSAALLISYVARASQPCCHTFMSQGGLDLLGEVLRESVAAMQMQKRAEGDKQEDAGMRVLACLRCLQHLPLTQAPPAETKISLSLVKLKSLRPAASSEIPTLGGVLDLSNRASDLCLRWRRKVHRENSNPATTQPSVTSPAPQASRSPAPHTDAAQSPSDEALRSKAIELISQGLLSDGAQGRAFAEKVEVALFALHGGATPKYRQHARMLKSNIALAGNAELRTRLLSGDLAVEVLLAMDSTTLAPEALQEERRIEQEKALRLTLIPGFVNRVETEDEDSYVPIRPFPGLSAAARLGGA